MNKMISFLFISFCFFPSILADPYLLNTISVSNKKLVSLAHEGETNFTQTHINAMTGQVDTMKELLSSNSSLIFEETSHSNTPFLLAVEFGWLPMVNLLLNETSEILLKTNKDNRNAMHLAVMMQHMDIVNRLNEEEVVAKLINDPDVFQKSPLYYALRNLWAP